MPRATGPIKKLPGRVSVYLDPSTLRRLDQIVNLVPDVDSRSAAIRHAARVAAERAKEARPPGQKEPAR